MSNIKLVLVFLLWSSHGHAAIVGTFTTIDKSYSEISQNVAVENMPRVRSQDSLGVCFGFSSATVAQHYICQQKSASCNPVAENKEVSPLSMAAWANPNSDGEEVGTFSKHQNIRETGLGAAALQHLSMSSNSAMPESCYPFDQFANKYGSNSEAVQTVMGKLKKEFDKSKTEGSACEECLLSIAQKELGSKTTAKDLSEALKKKTFEEFLFSAFMGSCSDKPINFRPQPVTEIFPTKGSAPTAAILQKLKETLMLGHPVVLDSICPFYKDGVCTGNHSVVVTGYRKICKTDNPNVCRDSIQIQNSWGADWQRANDDGWVDAMTLLGDKPMPQGTISWWVPKG